MVRDYVDPDQPRFTTVLDTRVSGPMLEEAVDLAASLAAAAAGADQPVRLVTPGGLDLDTGGGTVALRGLLDALCEVIPSGEGPLIPDELIRSGIGGLAVVTAGTPARDRAALAALRTRYSPVVVFVLGENGPVEAIPGATVLPVPDAAEAARRWNAITR
jgi:uncharacterized protein (DUF58 family)